MLKQNAAVPEYQHFVLSNLPPSRAQKRLALGIVSGLLAALYLVLGPFGGMQLTAVRSFVAIYATAMLMTESITAILLYAQFSILRSRAILVIASGYLFTALLIIPYTLAFPGVLTQEGMVGDMQTSARLYLLWHCGFPLFVICYALIKDEDPQHRIAPTRVRGAILRAVLGTAVLAAVAAFICIEGVPILPRIQLDAARFVPGWLYVVGLPISVLCVVALLVLWARRRSILDLFLMVVLCAYLIEILPHYYPAPIRFSTGWYAVRIAGFLSSSIVLVVLLYEISALYGSLLGAVLGQRREREARLMTGDAVAATIAHEVRQPLTAMVTSADAGLRFLEREAPNIHKAKDAFKAIVADGHRAGEVIRNIRDNFKSDPRDRAALDVNDLIREAIDLSRSALQKHAVVVHAEGNNQLPTISGNRVQLQQVLLNLITNAAEAMGTVNGPRILCIRPDVNESGRVSVSVADNGIGIDTQLVAQVFSPLYTTKSDGMGMGLSICRAIIEAHDGRLWFSPNSPHGSIFHFTLQAKDSVMNSLIAHPESTVLPSS
jgi:signal transduction histidine kinase